MHTLHSTHTHTTHVRRERLSICEIIISNPHRKCCVEIYDTNFWPIPKFHVQLIICSSQLKRHDFKIRWREKKSTQIITVLTTTTHNFVNWNLCSKTTLFIESKFKYLISLSSPRLLPHAGIHSRYTDDICIVFTDKWWTIIWISRLLNGMQIFFFRFRIIFIRSVLSDSRDPSHASFK